jgi:hypothetical protein
MFNGRLSDAPAVRSRPCASCLSRGVKIPATRILPDRSGRCEKCFKQGIAPIVTGETNEHRAEAERSH